MALELEASRLIERAHPAAGQIAAQLVAVPVDGLLATALDGEVAQPLGDQRLQAEPTWLGRGGGRLLPEQAREGVGSRCLRHQP
jgi:hypothetical protein